MLYGSLYFDLWYERRANVLLYNEPFSIAGGWRKSLGTEKVWERILKIVWDVCENEVAGYKHGNEVKVVQSYPILGDPNGLYSPWNFSGQNTGVGICSILEGIFPTQGSNPGLPHCRQILYQLHH